MIPGESQRGAFSSARKRHLALGPLPMSHLLWKYYWENDVERFRRLLAPASHNTQAVRSPSVGGGAGGFGGSPVGLGTSPRAGAKQKRMPGFPQTPSKSKDINTNLGRSEVNSRDYAGLTVLLRAASSTDPNAREFIEALLEHPALDLYAQDPESGWNALHRSLYAGNISIARLLLEQERVDLTSHNLSSVNKVGLLIKTKDHEGHSPFDVYNSTIGLRSLKAVDESGTSDDESDSGDSIRDGGQFAVKSHHGHHSSIEGDELFMFGSNRNLSLGVGDEDDRQYPERIHLKRPDQLLHRFYETYLANQDVETSLVLPDLSEIPTLVRNRPLVIQEVAMAKFHSAILTTDPVSNLYICGVGRGGRLGLGDENTQFKFVPVRGPFDDKRIRQVALGQNHTMAVTNDGELWTWGLNTNSQLGYTLPPPLKADEESMSLIPRQVFGPLKKEIVLGIAASSHHSVAHTGSSLYCWGRNVGQLALMDADSRSLEVQYVPRKVAASLLAAPIEMVSAIDKATTCLLSNHAVWVFANYGYNLVKFPFPDALANYSLSATSFSNRYDPGRRDVNYITSGGDTIAAVTARGDLFTMQLNNRELGQSAASTTNPVKIKGAITQPRCIWDSRKDGVASAGVGEHGSVIICTKSGAVWKRVKRTKGKTAGFGDPGDAKWKDFKFQRVPCITNCVAVRSSIFGAFAAIRQNSKVMHEEILITGQTLWDDIGSLLCLCDFQAPEASKKIKDARKAWDAAIVREKPGSVPYEVLKSADIERDLQNWLQVNSFQYEDRDLEICSSTFPDVRVPIHGWVLAGRSSAIREALSEFRMRDTYETELFRIEADQDRIVITLFEADIYTVLNLVVCAYQDKMIPVWKYTRESPPNAFRFRNVRTELMKFATRLSMPKLEAAVRMQTLLEQSLDSDFKEAISHSDFLDDGDVVIELDDEEVTLHSQLICQRCPFFEGLFHGRSQGQWLASRRDGLLMTDKVRIDLKHVNPETFEYVIEFLYADIGKEMFNEVTADTLDEFSEIVLDVMSVANELMLDRLSQICQSIIGKFVTTRNISNLLNEISPCSVAEFKEAGLEYICLQLESMLENHLLDDLDEELLLELDEMVRDNQLAMLPFARSGRAELLLHGKYPTLAGDIDEERQVRVKDMAFKILQKEDEKKLSSSYKTRLGSLDEFTPLQTFDTSRRKSRGGRNEPFSPSLRPQKSQADLIFDMEDDDVSGVNSPQPHLSASLETDQAINAGSMPQLPRAWREAKGKERAEFENSPGRSPSALDFKSLELGTSDKTQEAPSTPMSKLGSPWAASTLSTAKLDLKGIMSEASSKQSALTAGLGEQQKAKDAAVHKSQTRVSQKERKKQLQQQVVAQTAAKEEQTNHVPWEKVPAGARPAPWKAASPAPKTSLKDAMASESRMPRAVSANAKPLVASETTPKSTPRRTASPDTRFPGQGRTNSSPAGMAGSAGQVKKPLVPHSKSYKTTAPKAEPTLGLSMADIIGQQRREQELVKEAVAKRSLQEIQQEQAFQEWWDQESRRAQEEEARKKNRNKDKEDKAPRRNRRGRGGKAKTAEAADNGQGGGGPSTGAKAGGRGGASSSTRGKGVRGRGGNKS